MKYQWVKLPLSYLFFYKLWGFTMKQFILSGLLLLSASSFARHAPVETANTYTVPVNRLVVNIENEWQAGDLKVNGSFLCAVTSAEEDKTCEINAFGENISLTFTQANGSDTAWQFHGCDGYSQRQCQLQMSDSKFVRLSLVPLND